jgi:hypothetical protein
MRDHDTEVTSGPQKSLLNKVFSSAAAGVLVPLLSLLVGFTLTSWKEEVLSTLFIPAWHEKAQFNPHATFFWLLIALLAAVVWGGNWAKNRDSARTTAEVKRILGGMRTQSDKLTDAVTQLHSLPPRGVLEVCKEAYDLCEGYFVLADSVDLNSPRARTEIEEIVRSMLRVMERFVRTFDGEHLGGSRLRYGLNVMLYLQRTEYEGSPLGARLIDRLHFAEAEPSINSAAGLLDILPSMSIASDVVGQDAQLMRFSLLIADAPMLARQAAASRTALPGATDACTNMIHTAVPSIEFLSQTMDRLKTRPEAKQAVLKYFGQEQVLKTVQSFVCVPLVAKDTGMVGILNIHRDAANPSIEDKLALLVPLMTPFRHQLARLIFKYKSIYLAEERTAPVA